MERKISVCMEQKECKFWRIDWFCDRVVRTEYYDSESDAVDRLFVLNRKAWVLGSDVDVYLMRCAGYGYHGPYYEIVDHYLFRSSDVSEGV